MRDEIRVDRVALLFTLSVSILTGLVFGLAPGRQAAKTDVSESLNGRPVAIINETMARQYFAGENPIGRKIVINYLGQRLTREIVGVAGDVKQEEPSKPTKPEILVPFAQQPWFSGSLLVRSDHPDPLTVKNAAQQAIWSVRPETPESKAEPLTTTLAGHVAEPRLYALLLGVFGAIALTLAAVGIYSVIAYSVAQRTQEIGVRMALGAQTGAILKLVVGQGMKLVASGVALGLAASFSLTRLMSNMLFGVSAVDPMTFGAITLLLTFVALLACWIPARRATRIDPLVTLRR